MLCELIHISRLPPSESHVLKVFERRVDIITASRCITGSITSLIHEAINILTGSTVYQGIGRYFCDKVVHPDIL